jgi:PIN domain nuclease of toxin-antitoxin system
LSRRARAAVERSDVLASPMAVLELQTLYEINRVSERPEDIVAELSITLGLQVCNHPWSLVARAATEIQWTRDPFDRLIVAHAQARKAPLLTTDRHILRHYERAIS